MGDRVMSAADALAERAGISAAYEDIWGRIHRTSGVTRDTLLAALGFGTVAEASDGAAREAAAARTLEQLEEARWSAPLPPVVVVTSDSGELDVLITVPADRLHETLHWRIGLEDNGRSITGEFETAELPIVEQRVVRGVERRRLRLRLAGVPHGYHRFAWIDLDGDRVHASDHVDRLPAPMLSTR